jgi:alpha-glucoside transport system permease protein
LLIVVIWSIPTLGVLVSSFRTPEAINSSGWWTVFQLQRPNPAYTSLQESVARAETFLERTQAQLAEAQAALDAGEGTEEAVATAQGRVELAQTRLEEAQAALAASEEPPTYTIGSDLWRSQWTLQNYERVITNDGVGNAFLNSLAVTIPSVVIPITIAAFAAYAFAWLEFPGRDLLFAIVIISMGIPLHLALIPILRMYLAIDLGGTYLGIWLAHTGFGLSLAIFLIYGYMITIPRDIMESAHIDGASPFTAFTRLILPLSVPVIASFAIFQFLWVWNDLLVALVFLGTERQNAVLTSQLSELVGSKGQDWEVLTAGAFVTMIVPLIIFFALQRYFVRGLMAGSVKG